MKKITSSDFQLIKLTIWLILVIFSFDAIRMLFEFVSPLIFSRENNTSSWGRKLIFFQNHPIYYGIIVFFELIIAFSKIYMSLIAAKSVSKLNVNNSFFKEKLADNFLKISKIAISLSCFIFIFQAISDFIFINTPSYQEFNRRTASDMGIILLLGSTMYVLAYIFKKGTDLQEENDLTI
ncbi:DUF2975 domain-containing protein [Capnocytophaga canimorsus]|uniref:DUF2975 domain-containing protein n=1 Tax=Capnocytophaga canimorsus TaxID=28188 RepID=UPI001BB45811|nr:DUF2975 domain-containing protein [Capnocytophaga canimorsus]